MRRHCPLRPTQLAACAVALLGVTVLTAGVHGCSHERAIRRQNQEIQRIVRVNTGEQLVRFESDADLDRYVDELGRALAARQRAEMRRTQAAGSMMLEEAEAAPSAAAADSPADGDAEGGADESITNTQEAGVDEGGIVKAHGDHLVVLRRGRLFSVRVANGAVEPISAVDVTPPDDPHDGWYDEMLLHDDTIVVVGYSYPLSATELGLFHIDAQGVISHRETFYLTSADYYSSRNYASRLVGDQLLFYMPYPLLQARWEGSGMVYDKQLPGVRRGRADRWDTVVQATEIYRPIQETDSPVLHTVVSCDLSQPQVSCTARGVVGPYGRTFYVSTDAVWLWVSGGYSETAAGRQEVQEAPAVAYRLPLDGSAPGALGVWGVPTDQFSFKQGADGYLNVLVRAEGGGDVMWAPEATGGDVALLRVPAAAFTTRGGTVRADAYASLSRPREGYVFNNRFVGDHVLYGTGSGWGYGDEPRDQRVFVYPYTQGPGAVATALELPHGVDRVEVMGGSSVVIGTDGRNLHFTAVSLGAVPAIAGRYVQQGVGQGELRSHGFFYKPGRDGEGILGLPVRHEGEPGYAHLVNGSAEVMFLSVEDEREFVRLGGLAARAGDQDDRCRVSCVDWYGNARPIFYRGRVFALLGYELVEGAVADGRITEVRRGDLLAALRGQARGPRR